MTNTPEINPFEAPKAVEKVVQVFAEGIDAKFILKFRKQIHGLGILWIFVGSISTLIGILWIVNNLNYLRFDMDSLIPVLSQMIGGTLWLFLGIMACRKNTICVWIGMILTAIPTMGCIIAIFWLLIYQFALIGLFFIMIPFTICLIIVAQSIRVLKWAKQMKKAGISLDTIPE